MAIVFISHSSRDKDKVEKIVSYIEDAGFDSIFLDHDEEKGIKSGEHWEQRLYSEIKRTHAMLLILSPAWIDSKWCFAEYTQAKALGKEIIPIIIDHGVDNEVNQWIDSYLQKSDLTKDGAVLQRVVSRIKEISIKTQGGFPWDKHRAPYPGMMSFEEEDAAIFFGREDETIEVIEKLTAMKNRNAPKFLNIVAASGMGKSSFLKAGVLPQLKRSYSDRWIVLPTIRPTKRPLYAFAKLLASFLKKEEAYKSIYNSLQQEDYQSFLDDITTEIEFTSPAAAILFSLDQAEELYSLANKEEKEQFIDCLTYLVEEKEHFFTVWTLRSDFLKELQSDKTLKSLHKMMDIYALTPLKKENVTDIIKKPATVAGIDVDDRLIEKIKEDMQTTDALPLLALGLSELYLKHGKDGHLTLEEYKDLAPDEENPLEHIVKQKAEEAINTFKEEKDALTTLKEAFIPRLVGVNSKNEYIKRVALWDELPTQAHAVLEELIKARLLIKKTEDDREVVEIAHEALIRKWPLLQTWLTDEHEFLVGKAQLEIALQEYQQEEAKKDKYKAYLTGLRLQKASNWLGEYPNQLTDEEKAFIKESREFEQKQARKRKNIYTFAFLLVLLFGVLSAWQAIELYKRANLIQISAQKALNSAKMAKRQTILAIKEKEKAEISQQEALFQNIYSKIQNSKIIKFSKLIMQELSKSDVKTVEELVDKMIEEGLVDILIKVVQGKDQTLMDNYLVLGTLYEKDKETIRKLVNRVLNLKKEISTERTSLTEDIFMEIESFYEKLKKINEKNVNLCLKEKKLNACLETGDERAFNYYFKSVFNPSANAYNKFAEILIKNKKYNEALIYSEKAVFKDPNNKEYINRLINLYVYNKKYDEAENLQEKIIKERYKEVINTNSKEVFYEIESSKFANEIILSEKLQDVLRLLNHEVFDDKISMISKIEEKYLRKLTIDETNVILSLSQIKTRLRKAVNFVKELENLAMIKQYSSKTVNIDDKYLFLVNEIKEIEPEIYIKIIYRVIDVFSKNNDYKSAISYTLDLLEVYSKFNVCNDEFDRISDIYGNLSWYYIFRRDYNKALLAANRGLTLDPTKHYIATNLAHSYLFLGDIEAAKNIYMNYIGKDLWDGELFEDVIKEDFKIFRDNNLISPYFNEILLKIKESSKKNQFAGIGCRLDYIYEGLIITSIFKDSPAEKSGLRVNDIILKINGQLTKNNSFNASIHLLRGKIGSNVNLTVLRKKEDLTFDINITRNIITVQ